MNRFVKPIPKKTEAPTSQTPTFNYFTLVPDKTSNTSICNSAQQVKREENFLFLE